MIVYLLSECNTDGFWHPQSIHDSIKEAKKAAGSDILWTGDAEFISGYRRKNGIRRRFYIRQFSVNTR